MESTQQKTGLAVITGASSGIGLELAKMGSEQEQSEIAR